MNPKPFSGKYILPIVLVAGFSIILLAWRGQKQTHQQKTEQRYTDTVPKSKNEKKIRDLDDAIDELDRQEMNVNLDKIKIDISEAVKNINMAEIKVNIDKALKEVDVEKIKENIAKATKEINTEQIDREIKESIANINFEKINTQINEALDEVKKIDMSKLNADMEHLKIEMNDLGPKIEKEIEKAKVSIEKAKVELKEYKGFIDGLEKDGLINKKEGYTIEHKNGDLIINGKKQPTEVYNKYRKFLEKHKKFKMEKSDDNFNISNDDND